MKRCAALAMLLAALPAHAARPQLEAMAERAAAWHHVPAALLKAVCKVESNWRPHVAGDGGRSVGLCQVGIDTALQIYGRAWMRGKPELHRRAAMRKLLQKPQVNLCLAAALLRRYLDEFDGDETAALVAYNGGQRIGLIDYIRKVRKARSQYSTQN